MNGSLQFLVLSISGEALTHRSTILLYFKLASKLKLWECCYLCSIHLRHVFANEILIGGVMLKLY